MLFFSLSAGCGNFIGKVLAESTDGWFACSLAQRVEKFETIKSLYKNDRFFISAERILAIALLALSFYQLVLMKKKKIPLHTQFLLSVLMNGTISAIFATYLETAQLVRK